MEPLLEETIQGSSAERDEKKAQQKMNWKKSQESLKLEFCAEINLGHTRTKSRFCLRT